ncbi:MAG: sigma-70 family RNA polymerase sigma factor [Acidobacteriota bacterium]
MTETTGRSTTRKDSRRAQAAVRRIQQGQPSEENFQVLFETYAESAESFFRRHGVDASTAEDLAQDVMVRVYRGIERFRWDASVDSWILTIMNNVYKNHVRSRKTLRGRVERDSVDSILEDRVEGEGRGLPPGLTDPRTDPEEAAALQEKKRQVAAVVEAMPPKMRQCFLLRFQGLAYREIARMLGVQPDTVKKHLSSARARLRPLFTSLLGALIVLWWTAQQLEGGG